jgi:hypothetical protein
MKKRPGVACHRLVAPSLRNPRCFSTSIGESGCDPHFQGEADCVREHDEHDCGCGRDGRLREEEAGTARRESALAGGGFGFEWGEDSTSQGVVDSTSQGVD